MFVLLELSPSWFGDWQHIDWYKWCKYLWINKQLIIQYIKCIISTLKQIFCKRQAPHPVIVLTTHWNDLYLVHTPALYEWFSVLLLCFTRRITRLASDLRSLHNVISNLEASTTLWRIIDYFIESLVRALLLEQFIFKLCELII